MKKLFTAAFVAVVGVLGAQQSFTGKGDVRGNIGANIQSNGTGIVAIMDYGIGESVSVGVQAGYLLGTKNILDTKAKFGDKIDVKARLNANLGRVISLPEQLDVYPGLNLSLKNFGGHAGARYFFNKGFGVFTEINFPIARYKKSADYYELLNNQFTFNIGASFDLN